LFLRSIELFGFKSFPDRTRIDFSEGISALLGPNGCGKSNVVDAVKWVLGEQSTKTLRADTMEDVIFNGTDLRKPLNWAEVILTLSNESGILDLDLPEVTVGRRLFRSGDSEYSINKVQVKLKDVRELFLDTGVGKSAYSIMEQGRIDQILSNKPEERRYIFEEAAGISKYKSRSQEAEKKLEKTEENLRQVEGILTEVKRSYDTLKSQSSRTETYRSLRKEIFQLEKELAFLRLSQFKKKESENKRNLDELEGRRGALNLELETLNHSVGEGLAGVGKWEEELKNIQRSLHESEIQRSQNLAQEKILQERVAQVREQKDGWAREGVRLTEEASMKAYAALGIEKELEEFQTALAKDSQNISQFEERIESLKQQIAFHSQEIFRLSSQESANEDSIATAMGELAALTEGLVQAIDQGIARDPQLWDSIKQWNGRIGEGLEKLSILVDGRRMRIEDCARSGVTLAGESLDDWNSVLSQIADSVKTVLESWRRYEGSAPAILEELLSPQGTLTKKRDTDEKLKELQTQLLKFREERLAHGETQKNLESQMLGFRSTLEELKINHAKREAQRQSKEADFFRTKDEEAALLQKVQGLEFKQAEDAARIEVLNKQIQEIQVVITGIQEKEKGILEQEEILRQRISHENASLGEKEKLQKNLFAQLSQLQETIEKRWRENGETQAEIRNLVENFKDRHGVDLGAENAVPSEETPDVLRENLIQRKEAQKALGQVNLMAPEEFAEVSGRYEFLTQQLEDLRRAKEDLRNIVIEIRKESSELFSKTFVEIQKNFHEIFRRLFGGGRAEIRLTLDTDILDAGVEMLCQPPGKRLESIQLLSGGERSLTAVALLFAVYMVRPSPFCILDEIDAALDESNVGRFTSMLREFANNSQFIVITHNKRTVSGANCLIGVTMEESGVSKVIAIRVGVEEGKN